MHLISLCLSFPCDLEKVQCPSPVAIGEELQVNGVFT